MINNKKGAQLTLETIIVAILVLIVLAVLIFIFANKIGGFRTSIESCEDKGGQCNVGTCNGPVIATKNCEKCCIPVLGTNSP